MTPALNLCKGLARGPDIVHSNCESTAFPAACFLSVATFARELKSARLVPKAVRRAIAASPRNLSFAGYIHQEELQDAYCGADVFAFLSLEETEGIVVLEALSCGIPIILRGIPVYREWLPEGDGIWKARDAAGFQQAVCEALARPFQVRSKTSRNIALSRRLEIVEQSLAMIYQKEFLVAPGKSDYKSEEVIS